MDPFSMTDLLEDDPLFYYPRARRNRYRRHPAFFADLEDMTVDGLLGFVWNRDEDDREDEPKTIKQKPAKKVSKVVLTGFYFAIFMVHFPEGASFSPYIPPFPQASD